MLEATNNNAGGSLEKPKYLQGDWINKIGHTWWKPYILLENINGSSQRSNATKTRGRLFNLFSDGDDGKLLGHIMAFVSGDDENLLDPSFDSSKGTMKNPLGSTLSWCSPAETMEKLPGLFSLPTDITDGFSLPTETLEIPEVCAFDFPLWRRWKAPWLAFQICSVVQLSPTEKTEDFLV